jgi:ABC-type sugar transport system permease subunit
MNLGGKARLGAAAGAKPSHHGRLASHSRTARQRQWLVGYLFIGPFIISFLLFFVIPSIYSFALSFFDFRGYGDATFVGIRNYQVLLGLPSFWKAAGNMVFYFFVPLIPMLGGAFLLAVIVGSRFVRWGSFHKPVIFLPQVMAMVAAGLVFRLIFTDAGVLNQLTGLHIRWLTDPGLMKWPVAALLVWQGLGWYFVVFLAGLTRINPELYEAAAVDGATAWQQLGRITIPLMRPVFLLAFVIYTIATLRLFTEPAILLTGTGSLASESPEAAPIMNLLLNNVRNGAFGAGAAVGWILFVVAAVLSIVQFRVIGRGGDDLA